MSIFLLIFLVVIFFLNHLGYSYDWYYVFPWYDIPMHIMGGAWIAAAFLYLAKGYTWVTRVTKPTTLNVLGVVLVVGIGWEIYEYSVDIYIFEKYTIFTVPLFILIDSLHDLVNDLIGAAIVVSIGRFFIRKTDKSLTTNH